MGDLERRRAARDLWISRGHLKAALAGAFVLSAASFATGYLLGAGDEHTPHEELAFLEQVPGEDLVELLARVEANRSPDGAVSSLTFPDALAGAEPAQGPVAPGPAPDEVPVDYVAEASEAPAVAGPPEGSFTIEVSRHAALADAERAADELLVPDIASWVGARIVDGELTYVVSLGSFGSEAAAETAIEELAERPDLADAVVGAIP